MFTARYRGQVQSILVHKEMKVPEFLDALTYSLGLPEGGQIVGFQDRNGKNRYDQFNHVNKLIFLQFTHILMCII